MIGKMNLVFINIFIVIDWFSSLLVPDNFVGQDGFQFVCVVFEIGKGEGIGAGLGCW